MDQRRRLTTIDAMYQDCGAVRCINCKYEVECRSIFGSPISDAFAWSLHDMLEEKGLWDAYGNTPLEKLQAICESRWKVIDNPCKGCDLEPLCDTIIEYGQIGWGSGCEDRDIPADYACMEDW